MRIRLSATNVTQKTLRTLGREKPELLGGLRYLKRYQATKEAKVRAIMRWCKRPDAPPAPLDNVARKLSFTELHLACTSTRQIRAGGRRGVKSQ